jgi:hypothetical protein
MDRFYFARTHPDTETKENWPTSRPASAGEVDHRRKTSRAVNRTHEWK